MLVSWHLDLMLGFDGWVWGTTNNIIGVNSDDSISLNSGLIQKLFGGVLRDEEERISL